MPELQTTDLCVKSTGKQTLTPQNLIVQITVHLSLTIAISNLCTEKNAICLYRYNYIMTRTPK